MKKFLFYAILSVFPCFYCNSQSWKEADNLRAKYILLCKYDSALFYAEEAAALMRGTSGENNLLYGNMLNNLAISHYYLGNFKKAKYFILKEAALRESLKATDAAAYINCLNAASVICRRSGNYEESLEQMKRAEKKALGLYGSNSPEYANILESYAGVYHDMGCSVNDMVYIKMEERYLKRAEAIYLKNSEKSKYDAIINKSDQAAYNNNIGNSPVAESLLREVAAYYEKENAKGAGYASALNNLAVLYYNIGNFKLAEKFFVEAVDIYTKNPETGKLYKGICLNNLGALYHEMGNYRVASKLISEARDLLHNDSQYGNPAFAVVLNNLASVSLSEEYYASPENKDRARLLNSGSILFKADSVFRLNCQNPHPYEQTISTNLAIWYNFIGDKKKSAQIINDMAFESNLTLRVISMMKKMPISGLSEKKFGPEPALISVSINLMDQVSASNAEITSSVDADGITTALIRLVMGKAASLKKVVGSYHPAYATLLKSLIVVYAGIDDTRTEEELTLECLRVVNHKTLQDFSFLSENEKELYYQTRLPDANSFIAYSLTRKADNPSITCHTYNNVLLNKGLMLKSSTAMRLAILNSNNQALLKEYDEWISLQKEISILYSTPVEMRTKDVSLLESRANAIEKSLVAGSQDFNDYRKGMQITWEDVRKNLKQGEAAIEFTDYKTRARDGGDAIIYCALIVKPDSKYPEMIKLFNENQLKAIIDNPGVNDFTYINDIYGTRNRNDNRLYNLVWKPIEEILGDARNVYISPSGLLNKVSFPAISNGKDVFLCDKYNIEVKGSTGSVKPQNLFALNNNPAALVFGGIQYSRKSSDSPVWNYLEGTKDEGNAINEILKNGNVDVRYLTEYEATETFFKQNARMYNVLHMATHGFFFDDPNEIRFEEKKQEVEYGEVTFRGASGGFGVKSFVNNENPLMRSGLVLAGANDVWVNTEKGETDDGVLTAQEVTQIDMRKNDLVVLSACETGLGDIKGNEGVYGLQRALKMAGVKNIIMSLWEIPDKETVEFMGSFYKKLLIVKNITEAFSGAQKEMRMKYDPYFWGAFVLME